MALSDKQKKDIKTKAKDYVNGHVKRIDDDTFEVDSNTCSGINKAVNESMQRCPRPDVPIQDANECDNLLKSELNKIISDI